MISAVWDPVIERFAGNVPVAFIRALVHGESGGDSQKENPVSHAAGLLQITEIVRKDWNAAHPDAPVSRSDLFDPEINVRIGAALLNRIVQTYRRHPTLKPDWSSRRYAGAGGARVERRLQRSRRRRPGRRRAGGGRSQARRRHRRLGRARRRPVCRTASRFVSLPERVAYAKAVADLYLGSKRAPVVAARGGATGPVVIAVLGALGLAHFGRRGSAA